MSTVVAVLRDYNQVHHFLSYYTLLTNAGGHKTQSTGQNAILTTWTNTYWLGSGSARQCCGVYYISPSLSPCLYLTLRCGTPRLFARTDTDKHRDTRNSGWLATTQEDGLRILRYVPSMCMQEQSFVTWQESESYISYSPITWDAFGGEHDSTKVASGNVSHWLVVWRCSPNRAYAVHTQAECIRILQYQGYYSVIGSSYMLAM